MRCTTATALQLFLAVLAVSIIPTGTHAAPVNLDFSSGTFFDRPPGTGLDLYMQDGYTVEIANSTHDTAMDTCPGRWCFDNGYTTPAETTWITRDDGGTFDLSSVQVLQNGNSGLDFSADGGAFLKFTGVGTASFGPEFQGITLLRIDIPCVGQYAYCYGTIDNVNINAVPVPAALWLFGSGLLGLVGIARRKNAA